MGINANFSYNKNELLDLAGVNEIIDGYMINRIGEPYQSFYVYEVDGLFKSDEEAAAYEKQYGREGKEISFDLMNCLINYEVQEIIEQMERILR